MQKNCTTLPPKTAEILFWNSHLVSATTQAQCQLVRLLTVNRSWSTQPSLNC